MTIEESKSNSLEHIALVSALIGVVCSKLQLRAATHDMSKLKSPEVEMFAGCSEKLNSLKFGSDDYETERKKMLKGALKNHYQNNRHHPEFFEYGMTDMNLVDLIEMLCDWVAAAERQGTSVEDSIRICARRFNISDQLARILVNTAKEMT